VDADRDPDDIAALKEADVIKRELCRRSAIEPIIGHLKAEGHLGRSYLKGRAGDADNVVLSAVGHNFRRILAGSKNFCA
jgi:hypothetical protein